MGQYFDKSVYHILRNIVLYNCCYVTQRILGKKYTMWEYVLHTLRVCQTEKTNSTPTSP